MDPIHYEGVDAALQGKPCEPPYADEGRAKRWTDGWNSGVHYIATVPASDPVLRLVDQRSLTNPSYTA